LRELAKGLQMDVDKLVRDPERVKFDAEKQQMIAQQMQEQTQQPQLPSPANVNEAGDPSGGTDANTMNGVMQ
jgi:hypothetical protein